MALAGVAALGVGGYALWHGATLHDSEDADADTDALYRRRRRWIVGGAVLVVVGVLAIRQTVS